MGAEMSVSDLTRGLMGRIKNEDASRKICAQLNTAPYTDALGRVRIGDGVDRAMVPKSEHDRIKDLDLTKLCLLRLDKFEEDVHHNNCLSIFLGCDFETDKDGEKTFMHYIVRLDQQYADKCTCPKFCSLHGVGPMMSTKVSRIKSIEHDAGCIKDNMRYLIQQRILDPFKENKVFVLIDKDQYAAVGEIDSKWRKFEAFQWWIEDCLPRNAEMARPAVQESATLPDGEDNEEEDTGDVAWKSYGFDDMMDRYKGMLKIDPGSFYGKLSAGRGEGTEPPAKKMRLV
jgi:hypothetical protein